MTACETLRLPTLPEPLETSRQGTAMIVIDMQNGYLSKGGYLDLMGFDISQSEAVIQRASRVVSAARAAGMMVIHVRNGWNPGLAEAGTTCSPMWHKSNPLKYMRKHPGAQLLIRGTWDHAIVEPLAPLPGEPIVEKPRYSAFAGTNLEMMLHAHGIRTVIFVGVNTNVCVETAVRDAFHREFFAVMVEDATAQAGGQSIYDASVFNIRTFFGWTTTTEEIVALLEGL
ncbi:isochorismatase family protein [Paracandidimonas soli]|uniref:isochorismatase family protein n=1 Tax=Paracandidimonas soli TaxID=1917182 RepID=UPI0033401485